jgi:hypothetical protein
MCPYQLVEHQRHILRRNATEAQLFEVRVHDRFVHRDPDGVETRVAVDDLLGIGQPVAHHVRVVPTALIDRPARVDPVVERDHRPHSREQDVVHDAVVVLEFALIPHPRLRLDARPLHTDPVDLDAHLFGVGDVLDVPMAEVDRGAHGIVYPPGVRIAQPVAVGR